MIYCTLLVIHFLFTFSIYFIVSYKVVKIKHNIIFTIFRFISHLCLCLTITTIVLHNIPTEHGDPLVYPSTLSVKHEISVLHRKIRLCKRQIFLFGHIAHLTVLLYLEIYFYYYPSLYFVAQNVLIVICIKIRYRY